MALRPKDDVRKDPATFVNILASCNSRMMMETMKMLMTNDLIGRATPSRNALSVNI